MRLFFKLGEVLLDTVVLFNVILKTSGLFFYLFQLNNKWCWWDEISSKYKAKKNWY